MWSWGAVTRHPQDRQPQYVALLPSCHHHQLIHDQAPLHACVFPLVAVKSLEYAYAHKILYLYLCVIVLECNGRVLKERLEASW